MTGVIWLWAVFLSIILISVLFQRVYIRIIYNNNGGSDKPEVSIWALSGIISYRPCISFHKLLFDSGQIQNKEDERIETIKGRHAEEYSGLANIKAALSYVHKFVAVKRSVKPVISYVWRKIHIEKFRWHSEFGAGDAATTGLLTGLIWNAKATLCLITNNRPKRCAAPDLRVVPRFDKPVFNTDIDCILSIRLGHAIIAGTIFLINRRKGRWQSWANIQSKPL